MVNVQRNGFARLVDVAAPGWGQDGRYANQSGLDIVARRVSAMISITGGQVEALTIDRMLADKVVVGP